jgi:hypothetical protein
MSDHCFLSLSLSKKCSLFSELASSVLSVLLSVVTSIFSLQSPRNALLDEIEAANSMLMDTITSIADDNVRDGGTLIKLSYTAMSLAADLKSLFASSETVLRLFF